MNVLNKLDRLKSKEKTDRMVIYNIFNNNQASQVNFIEGRFKVGNVDRLISLID